MYGSVTDACKLKHAYVRLSYVWAYLREFSERDVRLYNTSSFTIEEKNIPGTYKNIGALVCVVH